MLTSVSTLRIAVASSPAHLDKVERGYENMDHYTVEFKREGMALRSIDFIQGERPEIDHGCDLLLPDQLSTNNNNKITRATL